MSSKQLLRAAIVSALAATGALGGQPPSFDDCLNNVRSGPGSFIEYLCLGTPGLPERAPEVRAALDQVLKRKPREPHARLYLALMRWYQREDVDEADFTEPLESFKKKQTRIDEFFAQLALTERLCLHNTNALRCKDSRPSIERADELARSLRDPTLLRLAAIARMRWSGQMLSRSETHQAEKQLDALPGPVPEWLQLLEVVTRVELANQLGDDSRVRGVYSELLARTVPGSVANTAALAGVAAATARLAWLGLADRRDAERLLRAALAAQDRIRLAGYNSFEVGSDYTRRVLAMLIGRAPETVSLLKGPTDRTAYPLLIELMLQGSSADRDRALELARELTPATGARYLAALLLSRAHAEFAVGSVSKAIEWGEQAIAKYEATRTQESDQGIRMRGDAYIALAYQAFVDDLLTTGSTNQVHPELAFRVVEKLRSRVLLETLAAREIDTDRSIPTVSELQSALADSEALVSFMVWAPRPAEWVPYTRGHSWALVLTKRNLRALQIADGKMLEPAVKAWTQLGDHQGAAAEAGARRLYSDVMKAVVEVLPAEIRSIIIVPDGPLYRLPFDALSATGTRPYLAERFAIATVSSASVWLRLRRRPPMAPGLAIAFANTPEGPALAAAERRGEVEAGQLAPLLHAREEAQAAVDAFPPGSRLLAGAAATPDRLSAEELGRASLVHFAAHGVANTLAPDESFLLLAPTAGGSGKLTVADVTRFDWKGKTVVLSACDTSVGAYRIGEGVLSLARGFFAGGASTVVGTLSQVRDEDQRRLFRNFYRELRSGVSVGEAMVTAKRALIQEGAPPSVWANVIVMGDASVHPRAPDPPRRWPLLAAAVLGAILIGVVGMRARRRTPAPSSSTS